MAAGRGEFFQSLLAGLERKPGPGGGQPGPGGGGQPGPGGGRQPGPGGGQPGGGQPGGGQPGGGQPGPGGGQPGGGQPGPGGGQPGPGRRQLGPGGQPGPGGRQPGPGGRQPGPGGRQPGPGGGQPGGGHPGPGVRQPGPGGGQPGPGVRQPGPGGGQTGPGGGQPGPGGGQPGPGGRQPGPRQPGPGGGQPGPGGGQPGPGGGQTGGGQPGPGGGQTGGGQPGPGGGQPGPGGGQRGGRRRKRPLRGAPSSVGGKERSRSERQKVKTSSSRENFIERLPSEILIKILSYLDSPSLFCIGHVSKLFHRLSSDDVMWHKIYNAEFGKQVWKPKWWDEPALKVDPAEAEDQSAGRWKKLYFRTVAGQEMSKWRRELTDINPYTGLPKHTERVLRSLNVSWELTVCDRFGHEKTMEQSRAYFFKSSAIVCWSNGSFPKYHHISNIQLHGVRKEAPKSPEVRRPAWRSLILKLDMKTQPGWFFGKDRLIKLMHLPPGFIVGIWRGQSDVAFIMVSLHLHKLVEKSLLGSPVCPYSEPADLPPVDDSDPEFGLHGYALHFVLHNTGSEIMLGHFCKLSCHTVQIQRGWVELRVINRTNLSQHRAMSGNITMPWKSDALEGSVENCCIISLTLLDEIQKPFWCVSSPIRVTMVKKTPSSDYSGEHFAMDYQNPEGQVKMSLVWLKEQKQFFLISLIIYVPVFKVNKHFSTEY